MLEETTERTKREKLCRLLLEKQKRMADSSLFYFCKYILNFSEMEVKPHYNLCQFLQSHLHDDILVLLPRGTFKSSVITVGLTMWELTKDPNLRFIISSYKENQTIGWLGQIKSIAETSQKFQRIYGRWNSDPKGKWQATAVTIAGRTRNLASATIVATSIKGTEVSQHCDRFIGDDLQTDENVKTREMVDSVERYIESLVPILDPQEVSSRPGPRRIVGTRWGYGDVYGRILHRNKVAKKDGISEPVHAYIKKAYTKTSTFFPKRFSREVLNYMKQTMNMSDYFFSCQYLNDPQPEGTEVFPLSDIGFFWYDDSSRRGHRVMGGVVNDLPLVVNHFAIHDPSVGDSADSDYAATDVVAVDSVWDMYIMEVLRKKYGGDTDAMIQDFFQIHLKYKPFRFGIESVAFQKTLVYGFEKSCREKGTWFQIEALKTDTLMSKDMRIRGFQPFVKSRKVYLRVSPNTDLTLPSTELIFYLLDGQDVLLDEMLKFPTGDTKDCIDALSYSPQLIFPAGDLPAQKPRPETFQAIYEKFNSKRTSLLKLKR
jgi:hypothetical protein